MSRLPANLPQILRDAGLKVVVHDGWLTRSRPASAGGFAPVGVLCHHTATTKRTSVADVIRLLIHGRAGKNPLPGPLAQLGLDRDGTVHIIAAGRANHAGVAKAHGTVAAGDGNRLYIGIEAFNDGVGEKWPEVQMAAYALLCATLSTKVTHNSVHTVSGHKETSITGKIDPTFNMDTFRARVSKAMHPVKPAAKPSTKPDVTALPLLFKTPMPVSTSRYHPAYKVANSYAAIDKTASLPLGSDWVRALDFDSQVIKFLIDGREIEAAIGAHWADLGRNGITGFINEHGHYQKFTPSQLKWTIQHFVDTHGRGVSALHSLRRGPHGEHLITLYEAMKYAKKKKVALCVELKSTRFADPVVAQRVVDLARDLNYPCWTMALHDMPRPADKCAAIRHAGGSFALIFGTAVKGSTARKAAGAKITKTWPVKPNRIW